MGEFGLRAGRADLRSAGPITFGPAGILFLADNAAAKVFAVDVADPGRRASPSRSTSTTSTRGSGRSWAASPATWGSGTWPCTRCRTMSTCRSCAAAAMPPCPCWYGSAASTARSPTSRWMTCPSRRRRSATPRPQDDERLDITLPLGDEGEELQVGERTIRILRQPIRTSTVTDMAYVDGTLLVAGLSNEEFSSRLRRIPFPFSDAVTGSSLEIFHVSHGKWETAAPIRTFVPYDGGRSILASYTCTPVVHFPLADLPDGAKAVGRTVAELGAVNQPLDMVSFTQDGHEYLLVANSAHGLVKIACRDIDGQSPLTEPKAAGRRAQGDQGSAGHPPPGQPGRQLRARPAGRRRRPQRLRSVKTASL